MLTAYQLHLPDDLRCFRYHAEPTQLSDEVIVFDGRIAGATDLYGRTYLFRQRWLEVFMTFDADLGLYADEDHAFPFVFNCDFTTPYVVAGNAAYTIDLMLDILVAADGRTYRVEDREPFEAACAQGRIGPEWCDAIEHECRWLTGLLEAGQFLPFLEQHAPFPTVPPSTVLSTCERHSATLRHFPLTVNDVFAR